MTDDGVYTTADEQVEVPDPQDPPLSKADPVEGD